MDQKRRANLEGDIRVLTQFLCNNHPLAEIPESTKTKNPFRIVLSNMATLLTFQDGHHTLCVLGDFRHPDDVKLLLLEGSEQESAPSEESFDSQGAHLPEDIDFLFTHNSLTAKSKEEMKAIGTSQMTKVTKVLNLAEVSSSGKTLEELARVNVPSQGDALTPFSHAQDVVAALHGFHQEVTRDRSKVSVARNLLKHFFVRRCYPQLSVRVLSDESVFGKAKNEPKHFCNILDTWISNEAARRKNGEIGIGPVAACKAPGPLPSAFASFIKKKGITPSSNSTWELNRSNMHIWVACLSGVLREILRVAALKNTATSPTADDFERMLASLEALAWFERVGFLTPISEEKSLYQFLSSRYKLLESLRSQASPTAPKNISLEPVITTAKEGASQTTSQETVPAQTVPAADDARDLISEGIAQVFPRYIKGITGWDSAVSTLTSSKWLYRPGLTFKVRQLLSPLALDENMSSLKKLAEEMNVFTQIPRPNEALKNPSHFKGTVHCEALIFALIYQVRHSEKDPFPDAFLKEFFECCSPCIGTSRKPCWMCSQLHSILFPDGKPEIEKSHGIIHAWNPPPNLEIWVLEELRKRLVEKFKIALQASKNTSKSQQSSPDSSVVVLADPFQIREELAEAMFQGTYEDL